jgi:mersacidin/lichenicidin family type 2 lantibiotic
MTKEQIIQAWKDEEYRSSLAAAERALLPENPAGIIELTDEEIGLATGAMPTGGWICFAISVSTEAFSCFPSCDGTIGGTCPFWTTGCCQV